jgi:hypothetical protein
MANFTGFDLKNQKGQEHCIYDDMKLGGFILNFQHAFANWWNV